MIRFLAPTVLALVVVMMGCAAAGSGDYYFVTGDGVASPAKSLEACQLARRAAWAGMLPGVPARTPSRCQPHANAFSARSLCIQGRDC